MSVRDDLMHLSPEALAQIANAGVVKRAVRELEGGYRPECSVADDATLTARFSDGIVVTWANGRAITQADCSCGAAKVCRHRIIAALAYRELGKADSSAPVTPAASPDTVTDEQLQTLIPDTLLALARQTLERGLVVDVRYRESGEPCDTARLPAATVRFWAGAAIASARCDCIRATACEHIVIAVHAFREAAREAPGERATRVRLGAPADAVQIDRTAYVALIDALARHGVVHGAAPLAQPLSNALDAARATGATWLAFLLKDFEQWSAAYAKRSALYDADQGVQLAAELALRLAAGGLAGNAKEVLGIGQTQEVELDRVRLVCLGARTTRDSDERHTRIVLADLDTGTQLVLSKDWSVPHGTDEEQVRASERLAPGVRLEQLAQGQLLAREAHRLADGTIRLARQRNSQNSVLPQAAHWDTLSAPLRYTSVEQLCEHKRIHPTVELLPRHAARQFIVFTPASVEDLCYDPNEQTLSICLCDPDGSAVVAQRSHEGHARHALDALAAGFLGEAGALRHVAGVLRWRGGIPVLEPWALACDRVIVPDFATATGALAKVALGNAAVRDADPLSARLAQLRGLIAALLHHGSKQLPRTWLAEAGGLAAQLSASSLNALAHALIALTKQTTLAFHGTAGASIAVPLLELTALLQLHDDARAVVRLT
jgi:hypothetical protein